MGKYQIGMVGLGVMGRNLVLNFADHGISVSGYDKNKEMVQRLSEESQGLDVKATGRIEEFIGSLQKPRNVMLLVPAGAPVDEVIRSVLPYLVEGDLIIDGGNSHFSDTDLRAKAVGEKGIQLLGVGISGGESGARKGPSMMPGGPQKAYQRVQAIFEGAVARVDSVPCVAYLGPGSAGHYVKMVHNGIEYGIMQLIAETYDLMKRGLGISDEQMHDVYAGWNRSELNSYLLEISAAIFEEMDSETGSRLINVILDEAKQKGTGMWASQDAMKLNVPIPTIDIAVAMRNLSAMKSERTQASQLTDASPQIFHGETERFLEQLRNSLYTGMIITYTQGFHQLYKASQEYEYNLNLETVARIWRGGCIIRSALLEKIRSAYQKNPDLPNLLLDDSLGKEVSSRRDDMGVIVKAAADLHIPAPGLMVSLGYIDALRSSWLPANLIQAQRDYFGSHTYERIDAKGVFHTRWNQD